jgi:ribosomal protein S18 acetylase RimI-like enzyme
VDAASTDAAWALRQYFGELEQRFAGGFQTNDAMAEIAASFNPPSGVFVVALVGDDIVGCGALQWIDVETAEIRRMWVDARRRGLGLGKRLLAHLESEVQAAGRTRVVLDTNATLTEAIAMYRSLGYEGIERYNDNPYAHHWFAKTLTRGHTR